MKPLKHVSIIDTGTVQIHPKRLQRLAADRLPGVGDATGLHDTIRQVDLPAARYLGMPILAAHNPAADSLLATDLQQHGAVLD